MLSLAISKLQTHIQMHANKEGCEEKCEINREVTVHTRGERAREIEKRIINLGNVMCYKKE